MPPGKMKGTSMDHTVLGILQFPFHPFFLYSEINIFAVSKFCFFIYGKPLNQYSIGFISCIFRKIDFWNEFIRP